MNKDVSRLAQPLRSQLLRFNEQSCVSRHEPFRNVFVTFPCGIRDHFPAVSLRVLIDLPDGVIVVPVDNDYLRANAFNRIDAPFGREVVRRIGDSQHIEGPQVQPRGIILNA